MAEYLKMVVVLAAMKSINKDNMDEVLRGIEIIILEVLDAMKGGEKE